LNNLGTGRHDRYARTGALEDLEAAIDAYQQAVQYTPPNSPGHSMYLNNLGKSRHDRYARTGALEDLEAAITAWKVSWSLPALLFAEFPVAYQLGRQRERAGIASHLVNAYLERATQHGSSARIDLRSALEVVESSKSRLLTQMVGRGPLPLPAGVVPEIAAQEQQLLTALTALDTQDLATYDRLADAQEPSGRLSRLWQRQAFLKDLEQLWSRIAHIGPEGADYVALRRGESVAWNNLARLAKELGPATALLSLFMTPNRVLLFLLRAGWHVPRVVEVELDQTDWDDLLERFFREIHRYDRSLRRGETWESALRPLLEEAQGYLKGVERLVLAPAGYGHLLPWSVLSERAGLRTSKGLPLPLVTLPAQGVLPRLRRRSQIRTGTALVVGNPTGDLPYAEEEAKLVAQHFGTHPLIGAAATKDTVLTRLAEASPVHLATHAFFDPRDPLKSGIILADGILTAREVLEHRMHTDLVVLSACESGSAVPLGGEELAGLGQAFFQAGAQSLLISLWRVSDPATATLMQSFYAARQTGADKALALRQAQTQVQQESHWRHPYYWGAFVLLGDWD
jgi:CHAT domain-containing protein